MNKSITRIGVLVSGGGTNMQAVMDEIASGRINGEIVLVISDNPEAYALERAKRGGIATAVISAGDFPTRLEFSQAIADSLQQSGVELVLMAGFMKIITSELTDRYVGRMINIHPALIPSFCGAGYYGHRVHEAVLKAGVKVSGCTVHFVEADVDAGPIIVQRCVPVLEGDTPDTLAARVLEQEHIAYPEAVRLYCEGRLCIEGKVVHILPKSACVS